MNKETETKFPGSPFNKLSEIERFIIQLKMVALRSGGRIESFSTSPESICAIIDCLRLGLGRMYDAVYTDEQILQTFRRQRT